MLSQIGPQDRKMTECLSDLLFKQTTSRSFQKQLVSVSSEFKEET